MLDYRQTQKYYFYDLKGCRLKTILTKREFYKLNQLYKNTHKRNYLVKDFVEFINKCSFYMVIVR